MSWRQLCWSGAAPAAWSRQVEGRAARWGTGQTPRLMTDRRCPRCHRPLHRRTAGPASQRPRREQVAGGRVKPRPAYSAPAPSRLSAGAAGGAWHRRSAAPTCRRAGEPGAKGRHVRGGPCRSCRKISTRASLLQRQSSAPPLSSCRLARAGPVCGCRTRPPPVLLQGVSVPYLPCLPQARRRPRPTLGLCARAAPLWKDRQPWMRPVLSAGRARWAIRTGARACASRQVHRRARPDGSRASLRHGPAPERRRQR
jgi:hypothetical protein